MIPLNSSHLATARKLLAQFRVAGKPRPSSPDHAPRPATSSGTGAPGRAGSASVDPQRSPAGWPITRDALTAELDQRLRGKLPDQRNT